MVSYFVRYRGQAQDPSAFLRYYKERHAPILQRLPGIRSLTMHVAQPWEDPCPVRPSGSLLVAQMTFEDVAALNAALQSDARRVAREDFDCFPQFRGEVTHEALTAGRVF